jgi:hypothetical protein
VSLQEKSIQCSDCGAVFTLSTSKQEIFASEGFSKEPKRCPSCRAKRKMERYGDGDYSYRSRFWRQMSRLNLYQVLGDPYSN